jgi:hypothetical protein
MVLLPTGKTEIAEHDISAQLTELRAATDLGGSGPPVADFLASRARHDLLFFARLMPQLATGRNFRTRRSSRPGARYQAASGLGVGTGRERTAASAGGNERSGPRNSPSRHADCSPSPDGPFPGPDGPCQWKQKAVSLFLELLYGKLRWKTTGPTTSRAPTCRLVVPWIRVSATRPRRSDRRPGRKARSQSRQRPARSR